MSKAIRFEPKYGILMDGEFPPECVADCAGQGDVTEAVIYWRNTLRFAEALEPVEQLARDYLREFGAWDDLDEADLEETIADRILWTACCDIKESGKPWHGLVH